MALEIRPVREDEAASFVEALSTAFLQRPDVERIAAEIWPIWEGGRTWAAVDDGQICGTFRSWSTELTVPGWPAPPTAAVSAVTVLPTHRRRGVLRSMMATEHAAIREHGQVFGLLHASEYRIYGRFGYGPASREATWTLDAERTTFHGSPEGSVQLVTPGEETRAALRSVFNTWRVGQVGEIRRRDHAWDFDLGLATSSGDRPGRVSWRSTATLPARWTATRAIGPTSAGSSASRATRCRWTSSTD